jgi:endonuclease-3 related protein
MNDKKELVYHLVSLIPKGKVMTYGQIAKILQIRSSRLIGQILHQNQNPTTIPCHRVVFQNGRLSQNYAFGGIKSQYQKLKNEGIKFSSQKIANLSLFIWKPNQLVYQYFNLLHYFGFPGPWPWFGEGKPATKEEIIISSILTQNTSWKNVEKAMGVLRKDKISNIYAIYHLGKHDLNRLAQLIKSSGFYQLKAKRLFNLTNAIQSLGGIARMEKLPAETLRKILLDVNGIGEETADCICLYAFNKPFFVIDAYTKKFVTQYFKKQFKSYAEYQIFFQSQLPKNIDLYKNYHALIVRWGKNK